MSNRMRLTVVMAAAALAASTHTARADIVVELRPDTAGPYTEYAAVTVEVVFVDDGSGHPITGGDILFRGVQFGVSSTGGITLPDVATWVDPNGLYLQFPQLPVPAIVWVVPGPLPSLMISLEPGGETTVALIETNVGASGGTIDVLNADDPECGASGGWVSFGFGLDPDDPVIEWCGYTGELTGGVLALEVEGYVDCNQNGTSDYLDIEAGTSEDCNIDGIPDECEIDANGGAPGGPYYCEENCDPDCNVNGIPDECDIDGDPEADCDEDGIPDECQLDGDDCNANQTPDECDIDSGASSDCQPNGVPDECEDDCNNNQVPDDCDIDGGYSADCNENATPDECDIDGGDSEDCNANAIPDECETDCNGNQIPDDCDIDSGASQDCNSNAAPDECDIDDGESADCNTNLIPDECELADNDCNTNSVPDECDLAGGDSEDCNINLVPDECDIAEGSSMDCDIDGVPDECESDGDGDGVIDDCDNCPDTYPGLIVDATGCPVPFGPCCMSDGVCVDGVEIDGCTSSDGIYLGDGMACAADLDGDGASGCDDMCPFDTNKTDPGACGCDVEDADDDVDGVVDCVDACLDTLPDVPVNECGCSALGACCEPGNAECEDDVHLTECAGTGYVYQGDGSTCAIECVFGDMNEDGHVDLYDVAVIQRCFTGVGGGPIDPSCSRGDVDGCGALDLTDFAAFLRTVTGP